MELVVSALALDSSRSIMMLLTMEIVDDGDGDNYDEKDNSNSINFLDFSAYWDDLRNLPGNHHKEAI